MNGSMLAMAECDGGCGNLVRPSVRFCDACGDLNRALEAKRLADVRRDSTYGLGEYARHDMGIAKQSRVRAILTGIDWPEKICFVVGSLLGVISAALILAVLILGTCEVFRLIARFW